MVIAPVHRLFLLSSLWETVLTWQEIRGLLAIRPGDKRVAFAFMSSAPSALSPDRAPPFPMGPQCRGAGPTPGGLARIVPRRIALVEGCSSVAPVELDVAATRVSAAQVATGEVAVGQLDLEYVVAARLALVARPHSGGARCAVDRDGVVNDPAGRIVWIRRVACDGRGLHVHAAAVVDVVEVAPERAVLDATAHTEVALRAGRGSRDPAPAGEEVARGWWRRRR